MQRERLGSRLGFILLSAGCAIGIGNVWKFPYMVGQYGGGAFVLLYLVCLIAIGVPVMTIEFSLGRASQKSPGRLYQALEPKGSKWHIHGYISVIGSYLLMMFYTTVSGWMMNYFVSMATGKFEGLDSAGINDAFAAMQGDALTNVVYMGIAVLIGAVVCSFSLQKGLERVTKVMMLLLLAIMVVLAVNSVFTEGGSEGLEFYLVPDIERMKNIGIGKVIVAAMNQAFFTLSLGMGAMAIFGSYLGKERSLMGESVNVAVLDTFVALTSGLIIFPACFAYGIEVDSGPGLIFQTLPNVFNNLPMGRLWGSLFFVFMSFAALSTVLAVFEGIIASFSEMTGISKKKSCLINGILIFVLSLPCAFGFNLLSDIHPFGGASTIMDLEDFIVSNLILPIGSIWFILFCTTDKGWGWNNFIEEANAGKGLKVQKWMRGYISYVLPVIVAVLFVIGLVTYFQ
ncbi:MAG: sodium-dependent transporter [Clostridia bacterium]|nr:sodium-dependent transporter [Clostridia bacterium]